MVMSHACTLMTSQTQFSKARLTVQWLYTIMSHACTLTGSQAQFSKTRLTVQWLHMVMSHVCTLTASQAQFSTTRLTVLFEGFKSRTKFFFLSQREEEVCVWGYENFWWLQHLGSVFCGHRWRVCRREPVQSALWSREQTLELWSHPGTEWAGQTVETWLVSYTHNSQWRWKNTLKGCCNQQ